MTPHHRTVPSHPGTAYLRWIAGLNLAKGLALLLLTGGLLGFLHKDIDVVAAAWLSRMGMDLQNQHIASLLEKLDLVTDRQLCQWSCLTSAFAGVFLTQGTGLWLRQRWAEYLTLGATASLIPFELFEVCRHPDGTRLTVLALNIVVVLVLGGGILRRSLRRPIGLLPAANPAQTGGHAASPAGL